MKIRKIMVVAVMALAALSIGAQVFAADQLQTKDQIKDQTKDQLKDGSCK